ncbi:MAG: hypothetical protein EA388_09685 [Nitriliruptor sp.]|nr:MAG: hypothetical protein EA388_09685 [Nitriliruptor sp.]
MGQGEVAYLARWLVSRGWSTRSAPSGDHERLDRERDPRIIGVGRQPFADVGDEGVDHLGVEVGDHAAQR